MKYLNNRSFDEDYVRRLRDGDPEIERHFTAYFAELLTIKLRSRLRSVHSAEDVRQETFLRVFHTLRRKGGVDHPERLGAFVNSVCNNVLLEHYRSEGRVSPMSEETPEPADGSPGPELEAVTAERKGWVRSILDSLPRKDQDLLRLIFLEDRDKDEVCRLYRVDRNYLRVLLHRARTRFRASMENAGHTAN